FDSFVNFPRLKLPTNIVIDELHSSMTKYGSSYLCVLVDNEKRCIFELLPSRSKHDLNRYFEKIPQPEKDAIRYVTMDMWLPYKDVTLKHFKNCKIAVDPFHVVKHIIQVFTNLRVQIQNQLEYGSVSYYVLKTWHRLLDRDIKLDNEPQYNRVLKRKVNKRELYNMMLDISEELTLAYQLKEKYRHFNKYTNYEDCEEHFDDLVSLFQKANLSIYEEFIATITNWKSEILNSFKRPYENRKQSNALAENMNSQIRTHM
ncbi:MAG: transposase, partial [Breznakia sp.]